MITKLTLPDGRISEYLISGDPNGFPLFFIHGTPGSIVPSLGASEACKERGFKLITFNRAGYGSSSRLKGRRIIDAVPDIAELKKHLGIDKCAVGGWSGGGPHTLACAARLPGCQAVYVVAGVAPYDPFNASGEDWLAGQGQDNIDEVHAALKGEPTLQEFCKNMRKELLATDAKSVVDSMSSLLPDVDKKAILDHPDLGQNLIDMFQESLKVSADGYVDDSMAFITPWGFDLNEIQCPVYLWQGSEDLMVPYSHGKWLAKSLPQKHLTKHLFEGEGHISIFLGNMGKMLDEVKAHV